MRAAVQERYGPPEVVRIAEVAKPVAAAGEVLVKIHATTVNRTDCAYRSARPFFMRLVIGLTRPRVATFGTEYAGEVEAVGDGVTAFRAGDRVFGYNEGRFGTHAEYLAVAADGPIATMPAGATYAEIAPGTEGAHYARSLTDAAKIGPGQDVLVHGATGAIGSAAVQLAKDLGATVTAVCATAHLSLVRGLGADRVVDYTAEDFTRDDRRYDVVIDAVAKSTFGRCRRLLKPGGCYLSTDLGPWWQNLVLALVTPVLRGKKVRFPIPKQNAAMVREIRELIEAGRFTPLVDRRYPLAEIVEAYRYVETGQKVGSVVITVLPAR